MFKRIIFLFLCSFLLYISGFLVLKSHASSYQVIYIEAGCDDDILEIEDCVIISGSVDLMQVGEYDVYYFNKVTRTNFLIKYIVVSCDMAREGIDYYSEKLNISYSDMDVYLSSIVAKDGVNIVAYYYLDHSKLNSMQDKRSMIKIFIGETVKATITFGSYCEVIKLIDSEAGFIALINYDENGKTHMRINEYSMDGVMLRTKIIASNQNDRANNLFLIDDYLYLIFNSSSSTLPFISKYSGIASAFIAKINYHSFKEVGYVAFGNNTSNNILDCLYFNEFFYIIFKPFGSGEFLKKLSGSKFVVKYDKNLNQISYLEVDNEDGYFGSCIIDDRINVFVGESQITNKLKIETIDLELKMGKSKELYISSTDYTIDKVRSCKDSNANLLVVDGRAILNNSISRLGIIKVDDDKLTYQEDFILDLKTIGIEEANGEVYLYCALKGQAIIDNYYNYKEKDDAYFINNQEAPYKIISDTYSQNGIYGNNQKLIMFHIGDSYYYKKVDYYKELLTSVINGETYEKGLAIYANGTIFLNDKEIKNGTKIEKEGDYLLKVYGNDHVVSYLEFRIDSLTNEALEQDFIYPSTSSIQDIKVDEYLSNISQVVDASYEEELINDNRNLGMALIIFVFFLGSSLIIPIKKKESRKK